MDKKAIMRQFDGEPSDPEKVARIKRRLPPEAGYIIGEIETKLQAVTESGIPMPVKYKWIRLFAQVFSDTIAPATACRGKGCSHCCNMAVSITSREAVEIGQHIGTKPVAVPVQMDADVVIEELVQNVAQYSGVPCPFLQDNKSCGIYEVRPIACVIQHSVEETPDACVIGSGQSVGRIDAGHRAITAAMAELDFPAPIADLRRFFPRGAK